MLQAIVGVPGIILMLVGGARSDAGEPRSLLMLTYMVSPIFPLFLFGADALGAFGVTTVMVWALGVGVTQSLTMPAQQAILNRISGSALQQAVTAATAISFVVQVIGLVLAGQLDRLGLPILLLLQAASFVLAAWVLRFIQRQERSADGPSTPALQQIKEGIAATLKNRVIANVLTINFLSTIFNAGAFMTVFPFIVKRVYDGDAFDLAMLMAIFYTGAVVANAILLKIMPLRHPGRAYLVLQLSRIIVLVMLYVRGDWWLLILASWLWGMNMGVTTNLARTIVQESADDAFRGRILSVFSVTLVGAAPIGAIVLGWLIEGIGTLEALLPAMATSLLVAAYGIWMTPLWHYRSISESQRT